MVVCTKVSYVPSDWTSVGKVSWYGLILEMEEEAPFSLSL